MENSKTEIVKDLNQKRVTVKREFDAPVDLVWRAFTEAELLNQWWGPAPWRAETKHMDFSVGGYWLYAMISPEGNRHWGKMTYQSIEKLKNFIADDIFCDENGKLNPDMPVSKASTVFTKTNNGTQVEFSMKYATDDHLKQIIEMGFEQGITQCFEQLEKLLSHSQVLKDAH